MLKIRLKRVGRKHDPSYRVVLVDSKKGPQTGKINEVLGFYDPRKDIKELKKDRIQNWISKGAGVSDTVHNILVGEKIIEGKKINVLPQKSPVKKDEDNKTETKTEVKEEIKTETSGEAEPEEKSEKAPVTETSAEEVVTEAPVGSEGDSLKQEERALEPEVKAETTEENPAS